MNHENYVRNSRRDFLTALSVSCAGLLAPGALANGALGYTRKSDFPKPASKFLTLSQLNCLEAIVDTIIPRTDSPGAADLDAHGFIDGQFANCEQPSKAFEFVKTLDIFATICTKHWKAPFEKLKQHEQIAALKALANSSPPFEQVEHNFFTQLKMLTLFAYYSSEHGGTKELVYDPIPGGYDGDFKVSQNQGKAFSIAHI